MSAVRGAVAILRGNRSVDVCITESDDIAWRRTVADAMRPCVITTDVDTARCAALEGKKHPMIVRCSRRLSRDYTSKIDSFRWILQRQWTAVVRVTGCGTGSARVNCVWNRLPIEETVPVRIADSGDIYRLIKLSAVP